MIDTNVTGVLRVIRAFSADLVSAAGEGATADLVAYTVSRPRHVNLRQIVVLPTRQA
ncbi:hypothetical protein [Streptosporangium saharense]|uniref:hypothetical protein n=1 Tax=Streptosporangium saharense TaxID=1706840 RepID=UPI0036A2A247